MHDDSYESNQRPEIREPKNKPTSGIPIIPVRSSYGLSDMRKKAVETTWNPTGMPLAHNLGVTSFYPLTL
jgi:hypothetical protein